MKGKIVPAATTALVLLLLALGAEADMCETRSRTFDGWCGHNLICASVCVQEHYTGGFCKGSLLHRNCMCTKECGGGGPPPSGGNLPPPSEGNVPPGCGDYGPPFAAVAAREATIPIRV